MRKLLILAGAVSVLALPAAAVAKDHGRGGHGHDRNQYERYDRGDREDRGERSKGRRLGCPPGLAKKHNGCRPPGQAWRIGQRAPWSRDRYVDYNRLPSYYRDRYSDVSGQRYYYEGNRVYTVDPTTQLIRSIINILR
jgi:Ni/Co efflux regulator RcnB